MTAINDYATRKYSGCQGQPVPHPRPVSCKVSRARETLSEALTELNQLRHDISDDPLKNGPTRTYGYWLGVLQGLSGYLLLTLEEQDAAR